LYRFGILALCYQCLMIFDLNAALQYGKTDLYRLLALFHVWKPLLARDHSTLKN